MKTRPPKSSEWPSRIDRNRWTGLIQVIYFDAEVDEFFLDSRMQYAKQKNDQTFEIDQTALCDFITIMTMSSYNIRPQSSMYWLFDEDVSSSFVRELVPKIDLERSNLSFMCVITNSLIQVTSGQNWGHYLMLWTENLHNLECLLVTLVLMRKWCHILENIHARCSQEVKQLKAIFGRLRFWLYSTLSKSLFRYILLPSISELVYYSNTFTARVWLFTYSKLWCQ